MNKEKIAWIICVFRIFQKYFKKSSIELFNEFKQNGLLNKLIDGYEADHCFSEYYTASVYLESAYNITSGVDRNVLHNENDFLIELEVADTVLALSNKLAITEYDALNITLKSKIFDRIFKYDNWLWVQSHMFWMEEICNDLSEK